MSYSKAGTRRTFLKMAGASTLAAPFLARASLAAEPITIFTWETYHENPWIEEWSEANGVLVEVISTGSVDEMYARTRSGAIQPDIVYIDSGSLKRYRESGLIVPLDVAKVSNRNLISQGLLWEERNRLDDQIYGIPYNWGTQPLMFDVDAMSAPDSWGALWAPENAGQVNLFDDAYITFPMIALYAGARDPYNLTDEEFGRCRELLRTLRPQLRTIARGFNDAETIYAAREAKIGYCQNISIIFNLREQGRNFSYTFPKEGTPTWIDNAAITPKGDRDEVYQFLSDNLSPKWQARFIASSFNNGVLNSSVAYDAGLSEDLLRKTNILDQDEPGFWPGMSVFEAPEDIDQRLQIWNDFKAGVL